MSMKNLATQQPRTLTELEQRWSLAALCDREIASLPLCEAAVKETLLVPTRASFLRLHTPRTLIAHVALAGRASGITLGRKVFILDELFGEDGSVPLQLVAHEVAHVVQYYRDGHLGFLTRYLADYARNLANGLSDRDAYLAIPHEVEARHVDTFIEQQYWESDELRALERVLF